jgi:hypothetical protein
MPPDPLTLEPSHDATKHAIQRPKRARSTTRVDKAFKALVRSGTVPGHQPRSCLTVSGWLRTSNASDTLTLAARLTAYQAVLLRRVLLRPEATTHSQLALELGTSRQRVHQTVRRLVERELIDIEALPGRRGWCARAGPALVLLAHPGKLSPVGHAQPEGDLSMKHRHAKPSKASSPSRPASSSARREPTVKTNVVLRKKDFLQLRHVLLSRQQDALNHGGKWPRGISELITEALGYWLPYASNKLERLVQKTSLSRDR